ncbi:type II toxin-antitoxin system HicB family antitoxin [Cellvibrio mixtus]|uniref:type II toxin-antitoxin system HicB family antitoxin n=1 Tax=Cellvibrio mixtus TaxID=39650 RepID=UPI0005872471|nr:type II toxin-antitoxin system HicB family antitoxin [Cellvibrio mixtus]
MKYPVIIEKDGNGFFARFPDIPEALTGADTKEETLAEAKNALLTAFEFYFEDQRTVPAASDGDYADWVEIPLSVEAKVLLLNSMVEQRITQSDLAKRMDTTRQEVQRIIDLNHSTKIDTLDRAIQAVGKRFTLAAV